MSTFCVTINTVGNNSRAPGPVTLQFLAQLRNTSLLFPEAQITVKLLTRVFLLAGESCRWLVDTRQTGSKPVQPAARDTAAARANGPGRPQGGRRTRTRPQPLLAWGEPGGAGGRAQAPRALGSGPGPVAPPPPPEHRPVEACAAAGHCRWDGCAEGDAGEWLGRASARRTQDSGGDTGRTGPHRTGPNRDPAAAGGRGSPGGREGPRYRTGRRAEEAGPARVSPAGTVSRGESRWRRSSPAVLLFLPRSITQVYCLNPHVSNGYCHLMFFSGVTAQPSSSVAKAASGTSHLTVETASKLRD